MHRELETAVHATRLRAQDPSITAFRPEQE